MANLSFKIPPKFSHNFEDERKELTRCREIYKEYETNAHLKYLSTLYEETKVEIEDSVGDKLAISEDVFDLLDKGWDSILCYYALMDNPKSPFQIFKSDYLEKSLCAAQTIAITNDLCSLIDYIRPTRVDAGVSNIQRDVIRNIFLRARCKYNSVVSPYEWQNILDMQLHIYQTRLIALSSETDIDADKRARVQSDKSDLMKGLKTSQTELRDLIAKYFGDDSPINDNVEQLTRRMTVFEEFGVTTKGHFSNIGQGKKW